MSTLSHKQIVKDIQTLVQTRSDVGVETFWPIIGKVGNLFGRLGLNPQIITDDDGEPLALWTVVEGSEPGPVLMLNACMDTAKVEAETRDRWECDPFSGKIDAKGWMHGRGAGDSKAGVVVNAHIASLALKRREQLKGSLIVVSDLHEHDGSMQGIKAFWDEVDGTPLQPEYAIISYTGNKDIKRGARGFYRARIKIHGKSMHSGKGQRARLNERAGYLASKLHCMLEEEPLPSDLDFRIPPTIHAETNNMGLEFATIPGQGDVNVDIRTTPGFNEEAARAHVDRVLERFQHQLSLKVGQVELKEFARCSAYETDPDSDLMKACRSAFLRETNKRKVNTAVTGPSNTGGIASQFGAQVAVFGVTAKNPHGVNEKMNTQSIRRVANILWRVTNNVLAPDKDLSSPFPAKS